jgi:hypothetical protein
VIVVYDLVADSLEIEEPTVPDYVMGGAQGVSARAAQ